MRRDGLLGFVFGPLVRWIVLGIGAVFVIAWIVTLVNVTTSDLAVTGVADVDLSGLTLDAALTIENGGILPVEIENIPYTVTLERTNATVASGTIDGFTLGARESRTVPFALEVSWADAGMTVVELLTQESVPATVTAQVRVQPIHVIAIPITIEQQVDLANYTAERTGTGILDAISETGVGNGLGEILDGLRT